MISSRSIVLCLVAASWLASEDVRAGDCDGNGREDVEDIASGSASDCNKNGIPDACELEPRWVAFELDTEWELDQPSRFATADFDQDDNVDLAVIEGLNDRLTVLWLDAAGEIRQTTQLASGDGYADIATLFLGEDGAPDIVVANLEDATIDLYPNQVEGGFDGRSPQSVELPFEPESIAVEDFDGDGRTDIVASGRRPEMAQVLFGEADGGFAPGPQFPAVEDGGDPRVHAADLEGDGDTDIVVTEGSGRDSLLVFRGAGGGEFEPPVEFSVGHPQLSALLGDFNGDSRIDIAVAEGERSSFGILFQQPGGEFASPIEVPAPQTVNRITGADFDGDGRTDIAAASEFGDLVSIHFAAPLGGFLPARTTAVDQPGIVGIADLPADGRPDLIVSSDEQNVITRLRGTPVPWSADCDNDAMLDACEITARTQSDCDGNGIPDVCELRDGTAGDCNGNGVPDRCDTDLGAIRLVSNGAPEAGAGPLLAADLDEDGDLDVAVAGERTQRLVVLENDGRGMLERRQEMALGVRPEDIGSADLDQDGREDLLVTGAIPRLGSQRLQLFRNAGGGYFRSARSFPGGSQLHTGDFDGDSGADVVFLREGSTRTVVFAPGRADGGLGEERVIFTDDDLRVSELSWLETGDLDGDGDLDIAVTPRSGSSMTLLPNRGDGTFEEGVELGGEFRPEVLEAADLDGDGDLDLAATGFRVQVAIQEAPGEFAPFAPIGLEVSGESIVAEDLDADGVQDLIVDSLVIWGDGEARYSGSQRVVPASSRPADLDGDGLPELVGTGPERVAVFANQGDRSFVPSGTTGIGAQPLRAVPADVDGDGDSDLAVLNGGSEDISVLVNTGPQSLVEHRIPAESSGFDLDAADFNGDGRDELVVTRYDPPVVTVYEGAGDPASVVQRDLANGDLQGVYSILARDMNGDDRPDIVTLGSTGDPPGSVLAIGVNTGDGTFLPMEVVAEARATDELASGDIDGDGDMDLAAGGDGGASVYLQQDDALSFTARAVTKTFQTQSVEPMALAQVVGSPLPEIILFGDARTYIFRNGGKGRFDAPRILETGGNVLATTDVDTDGRLDLVLGARRLEVLRNLGGGRFTASGRPPALSGDLRALEALDLDGDGLEDFAAVMDTSEKMSSAVKVFLNRSVAGGAVDCDGNDVPDACELAEADCNQNGRLDECELATEFVFREAFAFGSLPRGADLPSIEATDFDGDGFGDIAVRARDARPQLFSNDGRGGFEKGEELPAVGSGVALEAVDIDADADVDLVASGSELTVLENDGMGSFSVGLVRDIAGSALEPVSDLDGDARPDLLVARPREGVEVLVQEGGEDLAFRSHAAPAVPYRVRDGVLADFDADGDVDVVLLQRVPARAEVFRNDGDANFAEGTTIDVDHPFESLGSRILAGELDGDRYLDLVLTRVDPRELVVLRNDGGRSFEEAQVLPAAGGDLESLVLADLDGDGHRDLVREAGGFGLHRNRGDGTFGPKVTIRTPASVYAVTTLDADGDALPDIAGTADRRTAALVTVSLNATAPPTALDCDGDGVPDACEADCNGNGLPDDCDIARGRSGDTDGDGLPDECAIPSFRRGDANSDGVVDIADSIWVLLELFRDGKPTTCADAADANDDGVLDMSDALVVIDYRFFGDTVPAPPGLACGDDPTADELECEEHGPCAP